MQRILLVLMLSQMLTSCGLNSWSLGGSKSKEATALEKIGKYSTVESYYSSIEFADGEKPIGDPYTPLYYETKQGIDEINIGEYYEDFRNSIERLEMKRELLSKSVQIAYLVSSNTQNPIYEFLENRKVKYITEDGWAQDFPKALTTQADENKRVLDLLEIQYAKESDLMEAVDLEKLIILREENGDYATANNLWKNILCKKKSEVCEEVQLKIRGWVKDDQLNIVPDVQLEVLNDPDTRSLIFGEDGAYEFKIIVRPYQLVRVRYSAAGYMPLIKEIRIGPNKKSGYEEIAEVRLPKAKEVQTIEMKEGDIQNIETQSATTYQVQSANFQSESGAPYIGAVVANIFDFDPTVDDMGRVLEGSIRTSGGGVVPQDGMRSYGMAYIDFNTDSGAPLRISKQNPITVVAKVLDREVLYEDYRSEGQDEEVFWEYWIKYSKERGPFIGHGEGVNFASYWVYNQETGIWDEVPMEVIGEGLVRSIFYTHN